MLPTPKTSDAADRSALKGMLVRNSVRFGNFTLASGEKSDVYVDCKLTTYTPQAMPLIGRLMLRKFAERGWQPEAVGGLTLGADPIAFAIARESVTEAKSIPAFVIRKEPKKHGMQRYIEGLDDATGLQVVVIEDVATTGGSALQALEKAKQAGMRVIGAICLVDREMGARQLLEGQHGCPFDSIFKLSDLRPDGHA
jgi:orotate phosphoribosyltransferase